MREATYFKIPFMSKSTLEEFVIVSNSIDSVLLEIKDINTNAFIELTPNQAREIAKELLLRANLVEENIKYK